MELEELKDSILRDLNSEDYTFLVEIRGNTVIARWKTDRLPEDADEEDYRDFSVKYTLRKDQTFSGGEMTVHCNPYKPPLSAESRGVFQVTAPKNLKWRKKVRPEDRSKIGFDAEQLFSIVEHYLTDYGFTYRPGAWNHAYVPWEQGFLLRAVGGLLTFVGCTLFWGAWGTGLIIVQAGILIYTLISLWVLLIGLGKAEFVTLRSDLLIKLVIGIIAIGWLAVLAGILLEQSGI